MAALLEVGVVLAVRVCAVAGAVVSPHAALAAYCVVHHASLFHALLVWFSPPAGVLAWALETDVVAHRPGVFMVLALWPWPDALATLVRALTHAAKAALERVRRLACAQEQPTKLRTQRTARWNHTVAVLKARAQGQEYALLKKMLRGDLCSALNSAQLAQLEERLQQARNLLEDRKLSLATGPGGSNQGANDAL